THSSGSSLLPPASSGVVMRRELKRNKINRRPSDALECERSAYAESEPLVKRSIWDVAARAELSDRSAVRGRIILPQRKADERADAQIVQCFIVDARLEIGKLE